MTGYNRQYLQKASTMAVFVLLDSVSSGETLERGGKY
jgi:hypothetical protein